jgi:murein DD-endopeptidase MepM/ murein hydrolase activator NlpD
MRTLLKTAMLSSALGACAQIDGVFYGGRDGTIEFPGSGAGPDAPAIYITKKNDTVDQIAQRYGVSTQSIVDRNKLQPPYALRSGTKLELMGARPEGTAQEAAAPRPRDVTVTRTGPPPPPPQGDPPRSAAPAAAAPVPKMAWPVRGKILSAYGTKPDGQKNDGIDIAADKGTPVKAAEAGTVIYAGNEAPRMGNLLLVSHGGGIVTAYAHNEALLVKKGDKVTKGQTIARVGDSGGAPEPRLHFEVRRDNRTVDPMQVLPQ